MSKRTRTEYEQRKELQNAGWGVSKRDAVAFNSGSETPLHAHAKMSAAFILRENGYRVDSEVKHDTRGEIDILAYGHESRLSPIAVEVESNPFGEVVQDKLKRYVDGTPITEMYLINVSELPENISEMHDEIAAVLGL